jgi:predicted ATPase/class 3 adenylate cyclase
MGSLPSGTVTFLFTDIEGSTKLAQKHPDLWEKLRDRHHAILQSAAEAYKGYVFQIIGDAFCVAFHTASDAINAAVDAQRKLQNEDWGETQIKVRMGLHTGSAEFTGSDYRGYLTIAKVHRVMSVAYGGQVLLSNTTADLLHNELPKGIMLCDMNEHHLKGLPDPEHLWQMVAPNLQKDFPPLQSLQEIPNNLPVQLTSFIGREKEVEQVRNRLAQNHLITLTGSGGVGKTRLSLQVASQLLNEYPNGVWLVELAPITDPLLIPQTVCSVLDITPKGNTPALNVLVEYLKSKKILLVVDNCEHLINASAQLCDSVLHACPGVRIIASSREALGINGENAYRVPSLSLPRPTDGVHAIEGSEAVKLFLERAIMVQPDFELTQSNAPAVAHICQRLDGIALAIELAASRVKILQVEQIASRLDDAFRLLTGGSRTALPRQQTLRAMIDWSYNLLTEEERTALQQLSVFMGGWTLEAAEAVCGNLDILDLLTHLVDKSLVAVDHEHGEEARYYLLETIHQYARDKLLESGDAEVVRAHHLDFFLAFAVDAYSRMDGSEQMAWMKRLGIEQDNLRAAMDWAQESGRAQSGMRLGAALQFFWYGRGYWREGRERLERLLARPEAAEHTTTRALALCVAGFLADWSGDAEAALVLLEESQAISLELGAAGNPTLTRARLSLAVDTIDRDRALAQCLLEENLVLARELGDTWVVGWTFFFRGHMAIRQGDFALARTFYNNSLAQFRKMGNQWSAASAQKSLGVVLYLLEDYSAARSQFEEVIPIYREVGDKFSMAQTLQNLGYVTYQQGAYEEAITFLKESLALFRELERKDMIAWLLGDLGIAFGQQGHRARAAALLSEALPLSREVGYAYITAICLLGLAGIQQQPIRTVQLLAAAQTAFEATGEIIEPFYRTTQKLIENATRAALGGDAFTTMWGAARTMTLEQAIAFALEETDG